MGSRFLSSESFLNASSLLDGKFNLNVATINGFKPSGMKYSGTSNSPSITNTIGINGGSLKPLTFIGSDGWTANEFQDGWTYQIRQTGIINIADQFGSDGNLDLRVHMYNTFYAPSTTLNAVAFSDVFPLTSSTNKKWILDTNLTRRGTSILATSEFKYTSNGTTTFEGCIFGRSSNLDFTQPIKLDIRAYPTAGSISLWCETMVINKL